MKLSGYKSKKTNPRFNMNHMKKHRFVLLARPEGFEPTTYWFVASYSILLSYRRSREYYGNTKACEMQHKSLGGGPF